jgi:hypothetical protein
MNETLTMIAGIPVSIMNVETCIIVYVRSYGPINSLDKWAHEFGYTPWWVRQCAHSAERKGLVKLTRLEDTAGRPYQVTVGGGAT